MTFFFFFFQAEDGIRDLYVTGVQTCALPIYRDAGGRMVPLDVRHRRAGVELAAHAASAGCRAHRLRHPRSEERRVGKECRSRWSPYHEKKKSEGEGESSEGSAMCVSVGYMDV